MILLMVIAMVIISIMIMMIKLVYWISMLVFSSNLKVRQPLLLSLRPC